MPNSRVATYKQSYTARYKTIRRIGLRCEAGANHVETDPLKTASLLHDNNVSKLIEIEIQIQIDTKGEVRCGMSMSKAQYSSVSVQSRHRHG